MIAVVATRGQGGAWMSMKVMQHLRDGERDGGAKEGGHRSHRGAVGLEEVAVAVGVPVCLCCTVQTQGATGRCLYAQYLLTVRVQQKEGVGDEKDRDVVRDEQDGKVVVVVVE